MCLPVRWPVFPRDRRPRKDGFTTSMESPTATELALPGLEARVVTDPSPQHFIERGPLKRLMVFAGRSHPDLAQQIAEKLGVELGDVELETFANNETYCRYGESIRGADVFIVQTGVDDVDRNLMELVFMIQAAKLASAKRITAVVPLFPYARQDRKAKPREPISARLVADMIQLAGADRVLTMDLHAGQIQGFFTIPVDHMTAQPLFARHFRDLGLTGPGVVSVAPDEGRAKVAVRFANMIEGDFAIMHKTRPARDQAEITEVTGKVRDKIAIVGDDVIMTGGTLIANVHALLEQGAQKVYVYATHGVFCGGALAKFHDAPIEGMVVTDTVPVNRLDAPASLTVLPVAGLLAETIMNVFADDSVSAIFGGENQLF
jgi:ribose-phosphate pyrophosphokinase